MQSLTFRMLFRKKGTASTILAIALLIALLASVNALVNNINDQTNVLSALAGVGNTYLIVNQDSDSINPSLTSALRGMADITYVLPQTVTTATLTTQSGSYAITLRAVDDPKTFFTAYKTSINGSVGVNQSQANIGIILSNEYAIPKNTTATLTVGDKTQQIAITGITQTNSQADTQLIVPLSTAIFLTGTTSISSIEFVVKNPATADQTLNKITPLLSTNEEIIKTQEITVFAQDINSQILSFLNLWSIAIFIIVAASSYVIASRLITDAKYEIAMLQTIGAKKKTTFQTILLHTLAVALLGSALGIALGDTGAQVAATAVRWAWGNTQLAPFLELNQALIILGLALVAAFLGSIYPALKATNKPSLEAPL